MKKRFKLIGWFILWIITIVIITVVGLALSPIWILLWALTGKSYPVIAYQWSEDWFPPEVTS